MKILKAVKWKLYFDVGEIKLNLLDDKNNYTIFTKKGIGQIKIDEKIPNKTTIGDEKIHYLLKVK